MSLSVSEITASDIDGLISILEHEKAFIPNNELDDILNLIGATRKSFQLGLMLGFLGSEENRHLILKEKNRLFDNDKSLIYRRREIIFRIAKSNTDFLSSLLLCSARGIKIGGSKRITQILSYAELTLPLDHSSERWWLELRWFLRKINQLDIEKFGNIGDLGESLSMSFEKNRLNQRDGIERVSVIDGDKRGFDILSFTKEGSSERKRIEVKASTQDVNYANFHLTWHEWKTANLFGVHEFHLWPNVRSSPLKPIIISVKSISQFIPVTHESVEWNSIKVPMSLFVDEQ